MKKILVLYYSQTGQLKLLLDSVLGPLVNSENVQVVFQEIKPIRPFPFPWGKPAFFDVFPETYKEIPVDIEPLEFNTDEKFDLIVLGWTPWYLSPCPPISSLLQSDQAKVIFNNTPVVTVTGCRNMWVMGYEKLRNRLQSLNAIPVGNIVLVDKHHNLVSVLTTIGWLIYGKKENYKKYLPPSGVSEKDIRLASRFGREILNALKESDFSGLNEKLLKEESVVLKPELMLLERRGNKLFGFWANHIRKRGEMGNPNRRGRVRAFSYYLPIGIFILGPIVSVLTNLLLILNKKKVSKLVDYYLNRV